MSALGFYIDGVLGDVQTPIGDDNVVVGVGGSGGVYEGPARLVRNFDDLFNLQEGDVLVTIEAMKMETSVRAERDGAICEVVARPGQQVDAKDLLLVFEAVRP